MTADTSLDSYLRENLVFARVRIGIVSLIICGVMALQVVTLIADASAQALYEQHADVVFASDDKEQQHRLPMYPELGAACVVAESGRPPKVLEVSILWVLILIVYYVNILNKVYIRELHGSSIAYRSMQIIARPIHRPPPGRSGRSSSSQAPELGTFDDYGKLFDSWDGWINEKFGGVGAGKNRRLRYCAECVRDVEVAYFAVKSSVFADIPWVVFVLVFSLLETLGVLLMSDSPARQMGIFTDIRSFGQIIPMLLTLLPVFVAVEAISAPPGAELVRGGITSEPAQQLNPVESIGGLEPLPSQHTSQSTTATATTQELTGRDRAIGTRGVRIMIFCLSLFYFVAMSYVAVISSSNWFEEYWALSAHLLVPAWFAWGTLRELWDVGKKCLGALV
jgi:hypothetical protein